MTPRTPPPTAPTTPLSGYADRGVRLIVCPRGGKMPALDRAVAADDGEIVALGDANVRWDTDALRRLVRPYADAAVGMVSGNVSPGQPVRTARTRRGSTGATRCGCAATSRSSTRDRLERRHLLVRRESLYRELDPPYDHDISFPYPSSSRASGPCTSRPRAAIENMTTDIEDEYGRKARILEHCWLAIFRGHMLACASSRRSYGSRSSRTASCAT